VCGPEHHKGVDGVKTRLTGARAETSGHLSFGAWRIRESAAQARHVVSWGMLPYIGRC